MTNTSPAAGLTMWMLKALLEAARAGARQANSKQAAKGEIEWMQNGRLRMESSSSGFSLKDSPKNLLPSSPLVLLPYPSDEACSLQVSNAHTLHHPPPQLTLFRLDIEFFGQLNPDNGVANNIS